MRSPALVSVTQKRTEESWVWGSRLDTAGARAGDHNDDGVRRVICRHWRRLRRNLDHPAWCYLFAEGLVSDETGKQWRQRVWGRSWRDM